ncbi:MAG: alanine--glyoxylate aminotransferase family protein [Dehalococcoidia bacterium]|nr:alanine--glyoxylate aminotransferase family protein [Dehalococcoidia bacterium]
MPVNLRIPGPTPCPEDVLQAGAKPMMNHRGPEFRDIMFRTHTRLQTVFQTKNDIIMLTTSGTGGLEAAVANIVSPGDRVLCVSIGAFGDRFTQICEAYGAKVTKMQVPWGHAANPDEIAKALDADPSIKAVTVTHNETSTGVTNDIASIAKVVKGHDKLILVDAVSSLSCIPVLVDAWQCDVVVTASQKGFMVPPGLAFVSVSAAAWEANKAAKSPRFYFDFKRHKDSLARGETPWTPGMSLFFSLDLALDKLLKEGMENVYARHASIAKHTRKQIKSIGCTLFCADPKFASNTVTAINAPAGIDTNKLVEILRKEENTVVGEGQAALSGKIFRLGHMGYVTQKDLDDAIQAVKRALAKMGAQVPA